MPKKPARSRKKPGPRPVRMPSSASAPLLSEVLGGALEDGPYRFVEGDREGTGFIMRGEERVYSISIDGDKFTLAGPDGEPISLPDDDDPFEAVQTRDDGPDEVLALAYPVERLRESSTLDLELELVAAPFIPLLRGILGDRTIFGGDEAPDPERRIDGLAYIVGAAFGATLALAADDDESRFDDGAGAAAKELIHALDAVFGGLASQFDGPIGDLLERLADDMSRIRQREGL